MGLNLLIVVLCIAVSWLYFVLQNLKNKLSGVISGLTKVVLVSFFHIGRYTSVLILLALLGYTSRAYAEKKQVLFLGNSYTYYNNLPQIVADMALSTGDTLVFEMYAPGGYTINNHGSDTVSENRIKKGGWDYLILQEQSQLPSFPDYRSMELPELCALFRSYNPCGRIILYMTWGRENGDATNCPIWPPVCTYLGMDSLLRLSYTQMAVENKAQLSPVGAAWRYTRQYNPGIDLYEPDESHPAPAGSYLAACCFYTTIFKKDPMLIDHGFGLSDTITGALKLVAKEVVFDSLSFWDHAPTTPNAGFSYITGSGDNQADFINQSLFADSYLWDFGDGTTSTAQYPVHNYTGNGTYKVTLHAYNCDLDTVFEDTLQTEISFCPFTPTVTPEELVLCPGDSGTLSTQLYDAYQWYEYLNSIPSATGQSLVVSANNMYYVDATLDGCTERSSPAQVSIANNVSLWSIVPAGKLLGEDSACLGDTVALTVVFNKPPGANDSLIDWYFNGELIAGYHNDTLPVTRSGIYDVTVRHARCSLLDHTAQAGFTFVSCRPDTEMPGTLLFTVAPNPIHDILYISSAAFLPATCNIRLVNQTGQTIHEQQSIKAEKQQLNISGYPSGIYFIYVVRAGRILYRGKVVKR